MNVKYLLRRKYESNERDREIAFILTSPMLCYK